MEKEILKEPLETEHADYAEHPDQADQNVEQIIELIRTPHSKEEFLNLLDDYHDNDIAIAFQQLDKKERTTLYARLDAERMSDILSYVEDPDLYVKEMDIHKLARIITEMDSDDAVDLLDNMDDSIRQTLRTLLDEKTTADIDLIRSYEDDEIGSMITTNYILINNDLSIRQAMHELITQAGDNDNISTIYVKDKDNKFYGALTLKDLIIAREHTSLDSIISVAYPYLLDHDLISDCIERIKDYAEDSLPVLNEKHELIGIITAQDVIEVVEDEMSDDYAKLAGLLAEEDLNEKTVDSIRKRIPWLITLLVLGIGVSTIVGVFESVVAIIPIVMCFQSLILDMAGNTGTQSLAVTIRVLMDERLSAKDFIKLIIKEVRVGFLNGLLLGSAAFLLVGLYLGLLKSLPWTNSFLISGCVGLSLVLAMMISSFVGTLIPMFFHKIKVDPAVASGPLITTVNDLVAVIAYYGMAWIFLLKIFAIA